jgi:hypothetical protein
MYMDNLSTIEFEAHSSELNHHRRYRIRRGRDLLDDWTVAICHGRTGKGGREFDSPVRKPPACGRSSAIGWTDVDPAVQDLVRVSRSCSGPLDTAGEPQSAPTIASYRARCGGSATNGSSISIGAGESNPHPTSPA